MQTIKIKSLESLLMDNHQWSKLISENQWGFFVDLGKIGTFQCLPSPQWGQLFQKDHWTFKRIML